MAQYCLIASLLIAGIARGAELTRATVSSGKRATALVVLEDGFGTAFCIDTAGYFLTNQHVVGRGTAKITLVLNPALPEQRVVSARVVRLDEERDLALLHAAAVQDLRPLSLADQDRLSETAEVAVFGYPLGTLLAAENQEFPNISVSVGRITSLRRTDDGLQSIQLDADINPGNSGGPVVDEQGQVVAVVDSKVSATRLNFAIPVSKVHEFLAAPEISFEPPQITVANAADPVAIRIDVATFDDRERDFAVRFEYGPQDDELMSVELKHVEGQSFQGEIVPLHPAEGESPHVELSVKFATGTMTCRVDDVPISVGGRQRSLHEIRRLRRDGSRFTVELIDGKTLSVDSLTDLPRTAHLGDYALPVDFTQATEITVRPVTDGVGVIRYAIVLLEGGEEIERVEGSWVLGGEPGVTTVAEFVALGGQSPWPGFLEPSDSATYQPDGLRVPEGHFIRTSRSDFLASDFVFEIEFTLKPAWEEAVFVGIGEALRDRHGPLNSVYLSAASPKRGDGSIQLKRSPGGGIPAFGHVHRLGPHRIRVEKQGWAVSFHLDMDADGPTPDDVTRTVPDIRAFGPFLHAKNTHLFFGHGGTYSKVRLDVGERHPDDSSVLGKFGFHPWPEFLKADHHFTVSEDGLLTVGDTSVKTTRTDFINEDFTFQIEFEYPLGENVINWIGIGEVKKDRGSFGPTVFLRMHSPNYGNGEVGLNKESERGGSPAGRIRSRGPHTAVLRKRGPIMMFLIDIDSDGPSPDDIEKTVPNIGRFAPFLHEKNSPLFFGGAARYRNPRLTRP